MLIKFPAFGSIYYKRDLLIGRIVLLSRHPAGEFRIGLIAYYS